MTIEERLIKKKAKMSKMARKHSKAEIKKPYDKIKHPITIIVEPE